MPEATLEPLALEFDVSDNPDGKIGSWKTSPLSNLKKFDYKEGVPRNNQAVYQDIKDQFDRDFYRSPNIILTLQSQENNEELNIAEELNLLSDIPKSGYILTDSIGDTKTAYNFDNAFKLLTDKYNFSKEQANFTLASYTQGGFCGFKAINQMGLGGQRMIINIDKDKNFNIQTSFTEFPFPSNDDRAMHRSEIDLAKDMCPNKGDIFAHASVSMGKIDDKEIAKSLNIKATFASSSKDGVEAIKKLEEEELQKNSKLKIEKKPFKDGQNLCLLPIAQTTTPSKIINLWYMRLEDLQKKGSQGLDVAKSTKEAKEHFKNETLPLIVQMLCEKAKAENPEMEISEKNQQALVKKIGKKFDTLSKEPFLEWASRKISNLFIRDKKRYNPFQRISQKIDLMPKDIAKTIKAHLVARNKPIARNSFASESSLLIPKKHNSQKQRGD